MNVPKVTTNPLQALNSATQQGQQQPQDTGVYGSFANMLDAVNQQQLEAGAKKAELMTSQNKDIHGTMIALEKADISMRLMLQVRNKLVTAYEEVMRMQV